MKHVLLFIDSLIAGGAQRQLTGLACMLKEKGYVVKVVTYYNYPFYKYLLEEQNVEYECLNVKSKLCLPRLVKSIKTFRADVVISFQTIPNSLACVAAKICGVRLIVSERNTHQSITLKDKIIFQLYRKADYVVPNSYSEKGFIDVHFPFLKKKTITITNFVDLKRFHTCDNTHSGDFTILVAASVRASKNTKNFIRAYYESYKRGCRVKVVWYGVSPKNSDLKENNVYTDECIKMVEEYGIGEYFKLMHKRQDIENAYHEADVFCLPSHFEGTPNVICEAMASGLPIMASNVCDNSHFVMTGENGWLFNQNDIEEMSGMLQNVSMQDRSELAAMGLKSRKLAEKLCSEELFVNKYIKLIEAGIKK